MGIVRDFVNSLDNSKEIEQALSETLTVLSRLAEARLATFRDEMNKSWTNGDENMAPGTLKDFIDEQTHVIISDDTAGLRKSVTDLVTKATKLGTKDDEQGARIANFIGDVISDGLDVILGSGTAGEDTLKRYVIYPDNGFLMRMDVRYWRWHLSANSLKSRTRSVVAYRVQYGVLDYAKLDSIFIAHWFGKLRGDSQEILKLLEEAQKILATYKANQPQPRVAGLMASNHALSSQLESHGMGEILAAHRTLLAERGVTPPSQ